MHTDLSAHLHSDKCNDLIKLLRQCRIDVSKIYFIQKLKYLFARTAFELSLLITHSLI